MQIVPRNQDSYEILRRFIKRLPLNLQKSNIKCEEWYVSNYPPKYGREGGYFIISQVIQHISDIPELKMKIIFHVDIKYITAKKLKEYLSNDKLRIG